MSKLGRPNHDSASIGITVPGDVFKVLERVRGDVPRSVFIVRSLERSFMENNKEADTKNHE